MNELCPQCEGEGTIYVPDETQSGTGTAFVCPTCKGEKVIEVKYKPLPPTIRIIDHMTYQSVEKCGLWGEWREVVKVPK